MSIIFTNRGYAQYNPTKLIPDIEYDEQSLRLFIKQDVYFKKDYKKLLKLDIEYLFESEIKFNTMILNRYIKFRNKKK
jgi:hypothetical protein